MVVAVVRVELNLGYHITLYFRISCRRHRPGERVVQVARASEAGQPPQDYYGVEGVHNGIAIGIQSIDRGTPRGGFEAARHAQRAGGVFPGVGTRDAVWSLGRDVLESRHVRRAIREPPPGQIGGACRNVRIQAGAKS